MADTYTHKLYASHFMGTNHAEDCAPDFREVRLFPFGQEFRCRKLSCEETWMHTQTTDASTALPESLRPSVSPELLAHIRQEDTASGAPKQSGWFQ